MSSFVALRKMAVLSCWLVPRPGSLAAERDKRRSERERVQDCARNILQSVSATVDELFATFFSFAYPPEYVSGEKLQEAIRVARDSGTNSATA